MMASNSSMYRKPRIKPPRKLNTPQQDTFERLAAAIKEIQAQNGSRLSFEEHYRYAYTMVLHKEGSRLYEGISNLISEHLQREARNRIQPAFPSASPVPGTAPAAAPDSEPSIAAVGPSTVSAGMDQQATAQQGEAFLAALKSVWDDHTACMSKLKDLLKYMDRVYVENSQPRLLPTYELGLSLFLRHVIRSTQVPVHHHLISVLLSQIRLDRQGHVVNKSALRSCVAMLIMLRDTSQDSGLTVYQTDFEGRFLDESQQFYSAEAAHLLVTGSAADYLQKIERRLYEEDARVHHYLSPQTEPALVALLDTTFLASRLDAVLKHPDGGLNLLLEQHRIPDLSRLFKLFGRVPDGLAALRKALREWIKNTGLALAAASAPPSNADMEAAAPAATNPDPKGKGKAKEGAPPPAATAVANALQWVQAVLDLKDKTDAFLTEAFGLHHDFVAATTEAFSSFINDHPRAAEYISLFLDDNLRKGLKGKNDSETDVVLEKAIIVFRFLLEKDTFEVYYRRHLARRLLQHRSVSDDAERGVLAKLKIESGAAFVRDLEGMMKDVKLSADTMSAYRDHLNNSNTPMPLDLSVQVCTSSHWPLQQPAHSRSSDSAVFPPDFVKAIKSFEAFYLQRHSGRKLSWRADLGSVDVKIQFKSKKHEVNMSTQAMMVLSLFAELGTSDSLSLQDLATGTGVALPELKRVLQSLACGKFKILSKEPKGRDVHEDDRFYFNESFTAPVVRFKIQQIANRVETTEEGKATRSKVEDERKMLANAAIVRTMKDRKLMMHADLVNEVTRQLASRFQPRPAMIKQAIESMLEQEYLARDDNDRRKLTYVA